MKSIDGSQFPFIKDRIIMDCIWVANKTVEDYRHRKKRGLVLKLDLEKAYDYTDWDILGYIMERKGFGSEWRK